MGFKGIVVSDAMDMRAIIDQYGAAESVKRAVAAGADVLIQPVDVSQAIDAVVAGVQERRYSESRIDSSVRRVLELKHSLRLDRQRFVDLDSLRTMVGDSADQAMARKVADSSITVVKDSLHRIPLGGLAPAARLLSVTIAHRPDLGAGVAFAAELRTRFPNVRMEYIDADVPSDAPDRILRESDSADVTIVGSYVGPSDHATTVSAPDTIVSFIRQLTARGARPIIVAFGNPYFLQQVPTCRPMWLRGADCLSHRLRRPGRSRDRSSLVAGFLSPYRHTRPSEPGSRLRRSAHGLWSLQGSPRCAASRRAAPAGLFELPIDKRLCRCHGGAVPTVVGTSFT